MIGMDKMNLKCHKNDGKNLLKCQTADTRETLAEIIKNAGYSRNEPGTMAGILIANGATIPVRCKDCRHWEDGYFGYCIKAHTAMDYDGFCSNGERKNND